MPSLFKKKSLWPLLFLALCVEAELRGDPARLADNGAVRGQDLLHLGCYGIDKGLGSKLPRTDTYLSHFYSREIQLVENLCDMIGDSSPSTEFLLIKNLSLPLMTAREVAAKPISPSTLDAAIDAIETPRSGDIAKMTGVSGRAVEAIFGPIIAAESGSLLDASLVIDAWVAAFQNTAGLTVELDAINECLVTKRGGDSDQGARLGKIQPREQSGEFLDNLRARLNLEHLTNLKRYFTNLVRTTVPTGAQRNYLLAWIDTYLSKHQISQGVKGRGNEGCRESPGFYQWVTQYQPSSSGKSLSGLQQSSLLRVCDLAFDGSPPGEIETVDYELLDSSGSAEGFPSNPPGGAREVTSKIPPIAQAGLTINSFVGYLGARLRAFSEIRYGIDFSVGEAPQDPSVAQSPESVRLYIADWKVPAHPACSESFEAHELLGVACPEEDANKITPPQSMVRAAFNETRRLRDSLLSLRLHLAKIEARQKFYQEDYKTANLACGRLLKNDSPEVLLSVRNQKILHQWSSSLGISTELGRRQFDLRWHHLKVVNRDFESMFHYATKTKKALQIDDTSRTHESK